MNAEELKRMAAVMLAAAEGKEIQFRNQRGSCWCSCTNPVWDWYAYDYRVKPIAIKYRVAVLRFPGSSGPTPHVCTYLDDQSDPREKWSSFVKWAGDWHEVEV